MTLISGPIYAHVHVHVGMHLRCILCWHSKELLPHFQWRERTDNCSNTSGGVTEWNNRHRTTSKTHLEVRSTLVFTSGWEQIGYVDVHNFTCWSSEPNLHSNLVIQGSTYKWGFCLYVLFSKSMRVGKAIGACKASMANALPLLRAFFHMENAWPPPWFTTFSY